MRLIVVALVLGILLSTGAGQAQESSKPFILPVGSPPGPTTWLLGQPYGNTVGAFLSGADQYEAGQRLHFGLDFTMPCGTELVAPADGVVGYVDDMGFGAGPHNLILIHPQLELVTLFGHLLDTPPVEQGAPVRQGDVVALSGDPDSTCVSRPHLHFEVRALSYTTAYNPVNYIDANWHVLSAIGSFSTPVFEQDLDNARQWMSIDDQPTVTFWGRALNDYAAPYPDYRQGLPPVNPLLPNTANPLPERWQMRRLAYDGCCVGAWWGAPNQLFAIDGSPNQRAGIFEWNTDDGNLVNLAASAPPPLASPDGSLQIRRDGTQIVIRRAADGSEWTVDTRNTLPAVSADSSRLMWEIAVPRAPGEERSHTQIWVSNVDGSSARQIAEETGGYARWLDGSRLLLGARQQATTAWSVYDTADDSRYALGAWEFLRGISIAPGGSRVMFYLVNQSDPVNTGIYVLDMQPGAQPVHLPFFGAWRWRDADSLYYIPFEPENDLQSLRYYDLRTGEDLSLIEPLFLVANGDWSVSPDGDQIVFWNANDLTLWLLEGAP
ncbi:MAG: M23 family metallopeptidase [Anaerolineae bacterium]|nr:M23 family metallopeptidase [Anaerolineae bacterium]